MIKEVSRTIDQTAPHQLVVAKILGALNCTELLRVIKPEGARPFATTTDGMSDMRGAADIVVSFDGGFKYGLAIEVKTTTQAVEGAGPFKLFKAVKSIERNQRQFERLINSTSAWWYLVVHIGKLTAKTISEMDRALLDCPAVIIEGQHADATPDEVWGVKPLGQLLDIVIVSDRLKLLGAPAPMPSPQVQLDMLAHMEDVPVVTMDTPLKAPVLNVPTKPMVMPALAVGRKTLPSGGIELLIKTLIMEWDRIGEAEMKARAAVYPMLVDLYEQMKARGRSALSVIPRRHNLRAVEKLGVHDSVIFALALHSIKDHRSKQGQQIMPEATYMVGKSSQNLLNRVGLELTRPPKA